MRQHPIPHNILDIEFRLFGKFTAKQFAYIAIGVVAGGLLLIMRANGALPNILAWPGFLLLAGAGTFLGVVPINDQGADEIIANFFKAIQKPTRRVWKNKQFDQRLEAVVQNRQNMMEQTGANVIGSDTRSIAQQSFIDQESLDEIDRDEAAKLAHITALAQQADASIKAGTTPAPTPAPAPAQSQPSQVQQQPSQESQQQAGGTIQIRPAPQQAVPQNMNTGLITITSETVPSLSKPNVNIEMQKNTPYLQILDQVSQPVPGTIVLIKNNNGVVVQAHQTNSKGFIVPSRPLQSGRYTIEVQDNKRRFPQIIYMAQDIPLPPVSIKAVA